VAASFHRYVIMSFHIQGLGLAGSSIAWHLRARGVDFTCYDDARSGASSRPAAGLVNPVTGKNYTVSWRFAEFLAEAVEFYRQIEREASVTLWHPLPIRRLVSDKEWPKLQSKYAAGVLQPWVVAVEEAQAPWCGAAILQGGGRVDTAAFCELTEQLMKREGRWREQAEPGDCVIHCEGAAALISGMLGPHRCAKGEILTVKADWKISEILIGGGGWLVPLGEGRFKVGATYEWEQLDGEPTAEGREQIGKIARLLGGADHEVVAHVAGIRPIIRRSQPLIGRLADGSAVMNGLGSKGSLYAPGVAKRLVDHLLDGAPIDPELDLSLFLQS
jgi:glycine oxidase